MKTDEQFIAILFAKPTVEPSMAEIKAVQLEALLNATLNLAGQLVERVKTKGDFRNCFYHVQVQEAHAAAKAVWDCLSRSGLSSYAALYRVDSDEMIFRSLYPSTGNDMLPEDMVEKNPVLKEFVAWIRKIRGEGDGSGEQK